MHVKTTKYEHARSCCTSFKVRPRSVMMPQDGPRCLGCARIERHRKLFEALLSAQDYLSFQERASWSTLGWTPGPDIPSSASAQSAVRRDFGNQARDVGCCTPDCNFQCWPLTALGRFCFSGTLAGQTRTQQAMPVTTTFGRRRSSWMLILQQFATCSQGTQARHR